MELDNQLFILPIYNSSQLAAPCWSLRHRLEGLQSPARRDYNRIHHFPLAQYYSKSSTQYLSPADSHALWCPRSSGHVCSAHRPQMMTKKSMYYKLLFSFISNKKSSRMLVIGAGWKKEEDDKRDDGCVTHFLDKAVPYMAHLQLVYMWLKLELVE